MLRALGYIEIKNPPYLPEEAAAAAAATAAAAAAVEAAAAAAAEAAASAAAACSLLSVERAPLSAAAGATMLRARVGAAQVQVPDNFAIGIRKKGGCVSIF